MSGWPTLDRADDERLARALAEGDPGSLIQVMDRYAARLYDYCHALLRDQDEASGALHDALIAAYAHVPVLRDPGQFRGWLYALARNEAMRRLRDPGRPAERRAAPEVEDGFLGDAERARRMEARRLLHGALAGLRGREREALDLVLRHELDAAEVGGVLGMDAHEAADLTGGAGARLEDAFAAGHIARNGSGCPEMAAIMGGGEWPPPAPVVRELVRHVAACPACDARRDRTVSAARLLQVMPVATMPNDLRGHVMATATDPARSGDLADIAYHAEPFDAWGWPVSGARTPAPAPSERGRTRALWPVLAAVAAVLVIVAGAFFIMPGSSGGRTDAQASPDPSASVPGSSVPSETEEPSQSPTPTEEPTPTSSPTPTTTTTTATPAPSRTSRPPSQPNTPAPSRPQAGAGTLEVRGSCGHLGGPGESCSFQVRAVGGPVSWSVSAGSPLIARGGGSLAAGQARNAVVSLGGNCSGPGAGAVTFSPGGESRTVSWTCRQGPDENPDGHPGN